MEKEVVAKSKYIRGSAQKARIPADIVRGMLVQEALQVLKYMPKKAAKDVYKVVNSAVSNAVHNEQLNPEKLYISEIRVDQGPKKFNRRYKPASRGAGYNMIIKHVCHISVKLRELSDEAMEDLNRLSMKDQKKKKTQSLAVDRSSEEKKSEIQDSGFKNEEKKEKSTKKPSSKKTTKKKTKSIKKDTKKSKKKKSTKSKKE